MGATLTRGRAAIDKARSPLSGRLQALFSSCRYNRYRRQSPDARRRPRTALGSAVRRPLRAQFLPDADESRHSKLGRRAPSNSRPLLWRSPASPHGSRVRKPAPRSPQKAHRLPAARRSTAAAPALSSLAGHHGRATARASTKRRQCRDRSRFRADARPPRTAPAMPA